MIENMKHTLETIKLLTTRIEQDKQDLYNVKLILKRQLATHYEETTGNELYNAPQNLTLGDWDCPISPSGECVYDDDEDSCIYCGEPDERK